MENRSSVWGYGNENPLSSLTYQSLTEDRRRGLCRRRWHLPPSLSILVRKATCCHERAREGGGREGGKERVRGYVKKETKETVCCLRFELKK